MESYVAAAGGLEKHLESLRQSLVHKVPGVSWKGEAEALEGAERSLREARLEQHKAARGNLKGGGPCRTRQAAGDP